MYCKENSFSATSEQPGADWVKFDRVVQQYTGVYRGNPLRLSEVGLSFKLVAEEDFKIGDWFSCGFFGCPQQQLTAEWKFTSPEVTLSYITNEKGMRRIRMDALAGDQKLQIQGFINTADIERFSEETVRITGE
jgi:hypothetical protein